MNIESNEMKKRLVHQIAEDFYSRFESNDQKLERLRGLQRGEATLPNGFEIEGEIRVPGVTETHEMLLGGVQGGIGPRRVPVPEESVTLTIADGKRKETEPKTGAE